MRRVSLNYRTSLDGAHSDAVEVVLIHITHPALGEPIRLSTDPTERLTVEPLAYGTRSTWMTDDGSPFQFVLVDVLLPDDQEEAPPAARVALEAVDAGLASVLRQTTLPATVDMAVVLASEPDVVEAEFRDLRLVGAEGDAGEIVLTISRDPLTAEPSPPDRMTRARFPGLHA